MPAGCGGAAPFHLLYRAGACRAGGGEWTLTILLTLFDVHFGSKVGLSQAFFCQSRADIVHNVYVAAFG